MSFDVSWLATPHLSCEDLEARLQLRRTSRTDTVPEFQAWSIRLGNGWCVVSVDQADFIDEIDLAAVSRGIDVVCLQLHEGAGVCIAQSWANGQFQWSVVHDTENSPDGLALSGAVPSELEAARQRHFEATQSFVAEASATGIADELPATERAMFERMGFTIQPFDAMAQRRDAEIEIPVDMVSAIVGFRHDRVEPGTYHEVLIGNGRLGPTSESSSQPLRAGFARARFFFSRLIRGRRNG